MNSFSSLSHELFKPLASRNAPLYKLALESLHGRLITNLEFEDECTPKEAKETIRVGLLNCAHNKEWQEDALDVDVVSEADVATRIYNRLRDSGWVLEMDDIGYRRICSFSQNGGKLLTALLSLGQQTSFDIGSVCQGVYTSLQAIHDNPKDNAANIRFVQQLRITSTGKSQLSRRLLGSSHILFSMRLTIVVECPLSSTTL